MQRPTITFTIILTLTLHLLLNSQLVTRDELTYWRVDQTLTSAGCPLLIHCNQGRPKAPRQRKMRHGNPRVKKIGKWGGGIYLFVSRENKRNKQSKCSNTYLQTSLIPKFSHGDTPGPSLKRGRDRSRREDGERRGEVASWLSGGWTTLTATAVVKS